MKTDSDKWETDIRPRLIRGSRMKTDLDNSETDIVKGEQLSPLVVLTPLSLTLDNFFFFAMTFSCVIGTSEQEHAFCCTFPYLYVICHPTSGLIH